jgi:D-alanyl-D-alanine carboxypeptidase/D-alanyl-D-alanine-endopeptidase (penicillin-binding protein 4)
MKRLVALACLACCLLAHSAAASVESEVAEVLRDRLLRRAMVGIEVLKLGSKPGDTKPIFQRDADAPLVPASNLKLVTTSAALDRLGPDFRFRTALVLHGEDLVLIGDGDPSFGDQDYLKRFGWDVTTVFADWASHLKKQNPPRIRDVIVDDGIFDESFFHPHWPANQADAKYCAQVGGMNLNANLVFFIVQPGAPGALVSYTLDPPTAYLAIQNACVTGGENAIVVSRQAGTNNVVLRGQTPSRGIAHVAATVNDPPMYAAAVVAESIAAAGMKPAGGVRRDRSQREEFLKNGAAGGWKVVGVHETPLATVLARCNKDSVNLYAECLCKRLGHEATHSAGSWEKGTAAVGAFLKRIGLPESQWKLDDGSGLSKDNRVSPHCLTQVLAHDFHAPGRELFMSSLSVAGVDGTLEDRFKRSDLRQRIFGKSGFVEGVSTLSGFLKTRDGEWYVFSIMINGIPHGSNSEIKLLQERIVRAIDADASRR